MDAADRDAIFMHCLPAHRGEEVAGVVVDGPRSRIFAAGPQPHALVPRACCSWLVEVNGREPRPTARRGWRRSSASTGSPDCSSSTR